MPSRRRAELHEEQEQLHAHALVAGPIGHIAGAFVQVESGQGHAPDQVIVLVNDCRSGSSLVVLAAAPTLDQTLRFSQVVDRSTVPTGNREILMDLGDSCGVFLPPGS
jgi:hypothetical protein